MAGQSYAVGNLNNTPVDLAAEQVIHDEQRQTITAVGDVEMIQGDRIMKADAVTYDLTTDTVIAVGDVSLLDERGDVYFAESMELTNEMQDGFIDGLQALLVDGSRLAAANAERVNGTKFVFKDAVFTPCKPCEEDPSRAPLWQIRADEVVYDQDKQKVSYENARFEMAGIPVAYTPVFFHPDPTIDRRSGFLRPGLGWSSELGATAKGGYYWSIAEDKDATLEAQISSDQGILIGGEWRQRFENGALYIKGSATKSDRVIERGGSEIIDEDENRGYIQSTGVFDINNKWRASYQLDRVSDKQYLRQYDISEEDILENEALVERFSGRDYTRIGAYYFQDLRLGVRPDQPDVIPLAEHNMYGEPKALLGGRWSAGVSALGLTRGSGGQDVNRGSVAAGWERRLMSNTGLVTDIAFNGRGDFYAIRDRVIGMTAVDDTTGMRLFPQTHVVTRFPVARAYNKMQAVIEPIGSIAYGSNVDEDDNDIPNEDSVDVQLDPSNLFDSNRFPGTDRVEDGAHASYGVRASLFGYNGRFLSVFAGQSYRISDDDGLFPEGSGLEGRSSDYVGQMNASLGDYLSADYKLQVERNTMAARRHELNTNSRFKNVSFNTRYLFDTGVSGTGFDEAREEIRIWSGVRLNENWRIGGSGRYDLGVEPGLRSASAGIYYDDECFSFAAIGDRRLTQRVSGSNETTLFLRVGFKHLGEFSTPKFLLGEGASGE